MKDPLEAMWAKLEGPAGPPADPYIRDAGRSLFCERMAAARLARAALLLAQLESIRAALDDVTEGARAWQKLAAEHARRAARARRQGAA